MNANTISSYCFNHIMLLAGQSQYQHMGRRFRRGGNGIEWTDLFLPAAIVIGVVGIAWLTTQYLKYRERRQTTSPNVLFAELCKAHKLDWASQQLLRSLANAAHVPTPAHLFVDKSQFDIDQLGNRFKNKRTQIVALRDKLFAEGLATEHPASV